MKASEGDTGRYAGPVEDDAGTPHIDVYLSEMAISDRHGGGITVQRVLGSDLDQIGRFVHLSRFALDAPPVAALRDRSEFLTTVFDRPVTQRVIGCTAAFMLRETVTMRRVHAWRAAARVAHLFPGNDEIRALVCPQASLSIWTLEYLKRRRKVTYASWIMDDHVVRWVDGRWRYPREFRRVFAKHLREAAAVFVISPVLAERYKAEFGIECQVMFSPADFHDPPLYAAHSDTSVLSIGYFGSVSTWQRDALASFTRSLDGSQARLHVYSPDTDLPQELQGPAVVQERPVPKEAVIKTMRKHDAVLIPISFQAAQRHLSELNIATKMSECLASGTVTLVYGPAYAAMVRYLREKGAAAVLTDDSAVAWRALSGKLRDLSYRSGILDRARQVVEHELGTAVMSARWRGALHRAGFMR